MKLSKMFVKLIVMSILVSMITIPSLTADASVQTIEKTNGNYSYLWNCVKWVRAYRVPNLPYGLTSLDSKVALINSTEPRSGLVAVIGTSQYGHLAYVTNVYDDGRLEIEEANYFSGFYSKRVGSCNELRILGFYDPNR